MVDTEILSGYKFVAPLTNKNQKWKNGTKETLKFSSNMICDSSDETNFPHKLLLADWHIAKLRKAFRNNLSER